MSEEDITSILPFVLLSPKVPKAFKGQKLAITPFHHQVFFHPAQTEYGTNSLTSKCPSRHFSPPKPHICFTGWGTKTRFF